MKLNLIGKGSFSKVYDNKDGYVLIKTEDPLKDCLANHCSKGIKHLPDTDCLDSGLYRQPKYQKLNSVKHVKDWKILKKIESQYRKLSDKNYNSLIDILESNKEDLTESIYEALTELITSFSDYTYYIGFEIARRNLALDSQNELILLDVLYDIKLLEKIRWKKQIEQA
jgi:hypothetical protein